MKQFVNELAGAGATARDSHRVVPCGWDAGPLEAHLSQPIPLDPAEARRRIIQHPGGMAEPNRGQDSGLPPQPSDGEPGSVGHCCTPPLRPRAISL